MSIPLTTHRHSSWQKTRASVLINYQAMCKSGGKFYNRSIKKKCDLLKIKHRIFLSWQQLKFLAPGGEIINKCLQGSVVEKRHLEVVLSHQHHLNSSFNIAKRYTLAVF